MSDDQAEAELTAVMAALGTGLPQSEKTEWMATAMITLSQFPAALAAEALQDALTACEGVRGVLKHVRDYCEDYPERLRRRAERLAQLNFIAQEQRNRLPKGGSNVCL